MLKSYVIRKGHYTQAQRKAYDCLSQKYLINVSEYLDKNDKLNFEDIFSNKSGVTVEIGFGSGIATAEIAEQNRDKNYIGIEVHRPGIGRLLQEIEKRNLYNLRIIEYDAYIIFEKLILQDSLEAIHIFFPDPWPKKRHQKRRLVQKPFTQLMAGSLIKGGYIYMVTDWEDYALSALSQLTATGGLINAENGFAVPQGWRPETRFEQKGLEKEHIIRELFFNKI
ncbi:MAG: tRNA (guanosine(46)-N7)-methyltransferase TrmB [Treponema sp.]|nr:tRNA (guanosine(46)-N7)-methyltransferase TrmB [Treponema sp.]